MQPIKCDVRRSADRRSAGSATGSSNGRARRVRHRAKKSIPVSFWKSSLSSRFAWRSHRGTPSARMRKPDSSLRQRADHVLVQAAWAAVMWLKASGSNSEPSAPTLKQSWHRPSGASPRGAVILHGVHKKTLTRRMLLSLASAAGRPRLKPAPAFNSVGADAPTDPGNSQPIPRLY